MKKDQKVLRYEEAASVLPVRLRKLAMALPDDQKGAAEEFRLRTGQPLTVLLPSGEVTLEAVVEPEELDTLCDIATEFSRYAAAETLREGYLSVRRFPGGTVRHGGDEKRRQHHTEGLLRCGGAYRPAAAGDC